MEDRLRGRLGFVVRVLKRAKHFVFCLILVSHLETFQ